MAQAWEYWIPGWGLGVAAANLQQQLSGKDADWIDNISVRGGDRNPKGNAFIGETDFTSGGSGNGGSDRGIARISEGNLVSGGGSIGGGSASAAQIMAAQQEAERMAQVRALRDAISGRRGDVESAYKLLFGDLDRLARDRASDVERTAGENINKLTEQYTASLPGIESSYAALGAGDSTDTRDAKIGAKTGYESGVKEVGKNKESDLAKIGNYVGETKAGFDADRASILRMIGRVGDTEDLGDLRAARNSVEDKLDSAKAGRAKLNTDEGARGQLSKITDDAGRFDSIKAALDNVMNSSMSGGVKAAAVQAISNSSDLTDEDKQKIKLQYGNVYDTPAQA